MKNYEPYDSDDEDKVVRFEPDFMREMRVNSFENQQYREFHNLNAHDRLNNNDATKERGETPDERIPGLRVTIPRGGALSNPNRERNDERFKQYDYKQGWSN